MQDSLGGNGGGPGQAEKKQFADKAEKWGELPPKERAKAALELTDKMSDKHRDLIQSYLRELAKKEK
jgi:acyl-CoA reductase-like NAD-dependent aldehyde dehydrogenase